MSSSFFSTSPANGVVVSGPDGFGARRGGSPDAGRNNGPAPPREPEPDTAGHARERRLLALSRGPAGRANLPGFRREQTRSSSRRHDNGNLWPVGWQPNNSRYSLTTYVGAMPPPARSGVTNRVEFVRVFFVGCSALTLRRRGNHGKTSEPERTRRTPGARASSMPPTLVPGS